jgi:RNA polymerase sigma-70 factor (ECF subfamily)
MASTEMTDSTNPSAQQDESAVAAVRGGDAERYRELVERHERRVYAVAWSRLGDAALAEEATQEAFIRAYRRLWLLGDGAKFSGWVNTIARRVAINFGLRHRRELNKRERWALENPGNPTEENSANETDPLHTPETLRQTLAELPDSHRECLVLFYLEGKSGAEAAAALGISEAALRVRLHRARAAMRERLEEKLEGSLANLRPTKTLVPAVMAAVLVSSSAKAAAGGTVAVGVGAKILSVLGKTFLFSWIVPLFSVMINLPSLIVLSFIMRKERQNFRDADGFRPELHRRFFHSFIWGFPLLLVVFVILNQSALAAWGIKTHQFVLACFVALLMLISARTLTICRNPYQVGMFAYCLIITVGLSALAMGWIPPSLAQLPLLVATMLFFLIFKKRPARMDYSLFLRAAHGLLKFPDETDDGPQSNRFDRRELLAFARFLGSRFLVNNFRWETNGLALRLPPVANRFLTSMGVLFLPPISRSCSHISLGWEGTVSAHCGKVDSMDLSSLKTSARIDPQELESVVAEIVSQAWREFRSGNFAAAERTLGDSPESEVFVVPPARAKSMRWWRIFIGVSVVLMMTGMMMRFLPSAWMARLDGMKPVSINEAQVREFLSHVAVNTNPIVKAKDGPGYTQKGTPWDPWEPLFLCLILPETNLFMPQGLQVVHSTILGSDDLEKWRQNPKRLQLFMNSQHHRAIYEGWISWPELNLQPADCEAFLHTNRSSIYSGALMGLGTNWNFFLSRCAAWSWVKSQHYDVMRIQNWGVWDLRFLSEINSLDLVDREKLIQQIADVQTLSANPPGNPPIHDWRDVRGLFFTPCFPALQDTYNSLAALEILGGLDKIDREACIEGILKRHAGKGYFTSPNSGGFNEYHIDGSARDTIAAFESLRILGALDRVKDLDKWQFRVASYRASKPDANGVRVLTWDEIEAWVAQQRLEKILREHKEHPSAPFRSLLEP